MQPRPGETALDLGPALIRWRPPPPPIWQAWLPPCPGPASLCLSLLPLARPRWERVAWSGGRAAPPTPEAFAALPIATLETLLQGLCPPWLDEKEERDLAALRRHLDGRADFPGLDCARCRELEEQGEDPPDCGACPLPQAPASAATALALRPWLEAPPWLLARVLGEMERGLPPAGLRLLPWQLLLLTRWRRGRDGGGDCPLSGGRDTV